MKLAKFDIFSFILILIVSLLFVSELFLFPGTPVVFDGTEHISTIAQFSKIIAQGEIPVVWMNNFANYGLPIGIFIHQSPDYLGGLINLAVNDPVTSYNIIIFIAILFSNLFLYLFLRLYFSPLASFLGTFIFSFTPYRIFNIYVRGAMPEVFSGIFLPLILIALYLAIVRRKTYAFFLFTFFIAGLTWTHPMVLVVYSLLFVSYLIFLLITSNLSKVSKIKLFIASSLFMSLGVLICSYFVMPLNLEIKYLYYGIGSNHLMADGYLSLMNFFSTQWHYFTNSEIFYRGHVVLFGILETIVLILGLIYVLYEKLFKKSKEDARILYFALIMASLTVFATTKYSDIFFQKIFFLNNILFPWRFLSALIFMPPIIAAFLYDRFPKKVTFLILILFVAYFSFPQLYGKNFSISPMQSYFFSKENTHSILMNTIWTGKSEDYPDKNAQGEIIEGQGKIINKVLRNSSRTYRILAVTPLRMVDRTFYFPGWKVYIDNMNTDIQFQDPNYRGVITYKVPQGNHEIKVVFEDTKVRALGKVMSIIFLFLTIILFAVRKHIKKYVFE
jgi:uncharacterized membrane protein